MEKADSARSHRPGGLTMAAYVFSFGALYGYGVYGYRTTLPDGSVDTGRIYMWIAMALLGSALIVVKNRRYAERGLRIRITMADLGAIVAALVLIAVVPNGALAFALVALFFGYGVWSFKRFPEPHPSVDNRPPGQLS